MSQTSKSPKSILRVAHRVAEAALPAYSHINSPRTYTQHQVFACLALKSSMKLDYRGVTALLADCPELLVAIGMRRAPHYTTLQKASGRLLSAPAARALLDATVARPRPRARGRPGRPRRPRKRVETLAIDSTGLESRHASRYFIRRRAKGSEAIQEATYRRFPKLGLACDCADHTIVEAATGIGPRPDVDEFRGLLKGALRQVRARHVVADAGYDSEPNHAYARERCKVVSQIPAKAGRPGQGPPAGKYRRLMRARLDESRYHRRAQAETVMSMIKRRQGAATRGRSNPARHRDLRLMVITHNVMILAAAA